MTIFAPVNDFQTIRAKYPGADIQLYTPGTKLTATDIGLGSLAAEQGISDENLGTAKRISGQDRQATLKAYEDYTAGLNSLKPQNELLQSQLTTAQKTAKAATSSNPLLALIGDDPEMMSYYQQAQQAAKLGSRNALETLNTRGILNSSVTGDTVTGLEQQAVTNVLPQLYSFAAQKKQQALADAYNRVEMLGYVDNDASIVLGLPAGTPSAKAKQVLFEQEMANKNYGLNEAGLTGNLNGQPTMAAQQFDWQKAQDEWTRQYQQKGFDFDTSFKLSQLDLQLSQLDLQKQELVSNNSYRNSSLAIDQQNANTSAAKLNQDNSSIKLNDLIGRLNALYTIRDPYSGEVTVNPNAVDQLEAAILGQNLSDEDTGSLLAYYGLS